MTAKFEITVTAEPEHEEVRGHFASGEPEYDRADEEAILARLAKGEEWAWCCVKVTVSCGELSEHAYLGCCSYQDEEDFRADGYFDDMVHECKVELLKRAMRQRDEALEVLAAFDAETRGEG